MDAMELDALAATAKWNAKQRGEQREGECVAGRVTARAIPFGRPSTGLSSPSAGYRVNFYVDGLILPKSLVISFLAANPEPAKC